MMMFTVGSTLRNQTACIHFGDVQPSALSIGRTGHNGARRSCGGIANGDVTVRSWPPAPRAEHVALITCNGSLPATGGRREKMLCRSQYWARAAQLSRIQGFACAPAMVSALGPPSSWGVV